MRDGDRATVTPALNSLPAAVATLAVTAESSHAYELRFVASEVA